MWFKAILALFCVAQFSAAHNTVCLFENIGVLVTTYTCTLVNQNIQSEDQMKEIGGTHLPGFTDANVTALLQAGSTIAVFPSLIIDRFVNMQTVILSSVEMTSFGRPITNCDNLQSVSLGNGGLTSIPPGIFRNCVNMIQLSLTNQPINRIHADAFAGLNTMHTMSMSGANIQTLDPHVFSSMTGLITLELQNNQISTISTYFPRFHRLSVLKLSNNNLTTWNPMYLVANPQLEHLFLERNEIATLTSNTFANLPKLTYLSVGDSLTKLPVFKNLGQLDTLSIERCPLKYVDAASFRNMASLRQLVLQNNQIATFDFSARKPPILQRLTHLNLGNNQIENVTDYSLGTLTAMNRLYLQNNLITRIGERSLRPIIDSVGTLDLRDNDIQCIESGLFENVTSLTIKMSGCYDGNVELGTNLQSSSQDFIDNCLCSDLNLKVNT